MAIGVCIPVEKFDIANEAKYIDGCRKMLASASERIGVVSMTEVTGMIIIIGIIVMLEFNAMCERYKLDMSIMDIDYKLEEMTLILTKSGEGDVPKLVKATDVIDVLSAELDIPILELVDVMAAVPSVETGGCE